MRPLPPDDHVFAAAAAATRDGGIHFVCADWNGVAAVMSAAETVYGMTIDGAVWVGSEARSAPWTAPLVAKHQGS
jgi:hypothetical protein